MSEPAILVEALSKRYRIGSRAERPDTLVGTMVEWLRAPVDNYRRLRALRHFTDDEAEDVLWALRDVSFQVGVGEVIGVIGHNGAGKSTLLKVLSRITEPSRGRIVLRGRVASLLEVGTGFHPELTGRENVYLNGTILGMSKREVDRKFDEIVNFAEVERFIETPVKRYSSGMKVRLAFSVAAHLEPEILLVDEVLAVGDLAFQRKSLGKMNSVAQAGRTVLFVSHNMGAINRLAPKTFWFHQGRLRMSGATEDVVSEYVKHGSSVSGQHDWSAGEAAVEELELEQLQLLDASGTQASSLDVRRPFEVEIVYRVRKPMPRLRLGLFVTTLEGTVVFDTYDADDERFQGERQPGRFTARCRIPGNLLMPATYTLTVNADITGIKRLLREENVLMFEIVNTGAVGAQVGGRRRGVILPKLDWQVSAERADDGISPPSSEAAPSRDG